MRVSPLDINLSLQLHGAMRTTLTLDDDVAELVARRAKARGLSLGKTMSDLVRRGLNAPTPSTDKRMASWFSNCRRIPPKSPRTTCAASKRRAHEGLLELITAGA